MIRATLRIVILLSIVVSARSVLADHYHVPTGSMEPTVAIGDRIAVNKAAYGLRVPLLDTYIVEFDGPERGDVVVLASPDDGETLLKRVVAIPGDNVVVRAGRLTINGHEVPSGDSAIDGTHGPSTETPLEHLGVPHHLRLADGGGPDFGPAKVPQDSYLVMGDNRGNSYDGRQFGWVERDAIRGQALGVFHGLADGFTWRKL